MACIWLGPGASNQEARKRTTPHHANSCSPGPEIDFYVDRRRACNCRPVKVNKSIESDARGSFKQPRGPRGARRWQQDGHVHHDAGQDQVSLGAPGPDLQLDRVRRPSRAKTAPLRPSPPHFFVFLSRRPDGRLVIAARAAALPSSHQIPSLGDTFTMGLAN